MAQAQREFGGRSRERFSQTLLDLGERLGSVDLSRDTLSGVVKTPRAAALPHQSRLRQQFVQLFPGIEERLALLEQRRWRVRIPVPVHAAPSARVALNLFAHAIVGFRNGTERSRGIQNEKGRAPWPFGQELHV